MKRKGLRNSAGDLALRWEVARGLALRTPHICRVFVIAAPQDPHDTGIPRFPIGGDLVNPGRRCSSCCRRCPLSMALLLPSNNKGFTCLYSTASGNTASMTDEKPTFLASVGLMGQVASCRPFPPSSRYEVTERPGWQPRGLPDLSNFD